MKQNNFYLIGDVDIHNIYEYKIYIQNVKPIVEKYGGEYLVRGGEIIEKEINLVNFKFYQKLFVFIISCSTILIIPESPRELENICESYNSRTICNVW